MGWNIYVCYIFKDVFRNEIQIEMQFATELLHSMFQLKNTKCNIMLEERSWKLGNIDMLFQNIVISVVM